MTLEERYGWQYARALSNRILPLSIRRFSIDNFSDSLAARLDVTAKGLLGIGDSGSVFEASLKGSFDQPTAVVAIKFEALHGKVANFSCCSRLSPLRKLITLYLHNVPPSTTFVLFRRMA